jgi:hypothetical protein
MNEVARVALEVIGQMFKVSYLVAIAQQNLGLRLWLDHIR